MSEAGGRRPDDGRPEGGRPVGVHAGETTLLDLARCGDEHAFSELAATYRAELLAHCYRMLGSVHDAEDALQETLVRAWRGLARFEGRGSVRSWLYSIATNAALDSLRHRSRRELPVTFGPSASAGTDLGAPLTELPWLEAYPDQWLADVRQSPEARYEQRESVEIAFVAALQYLPPPQRAVLLLREVVGMSTAEICSQLGMSAPSVNSALQRARAAARSRLPAQSQQTTLRLLGEQRIRVIAESYADAIERGDADRLISMLTHDATWSMPPVATWYGGHQAVRDFLVRYPLTQRWRHLTTRANGQLAVGCYMLDQVTGRYEPAVLDVLTLDGEKVAAVTAFLADTVVGSEGREWIAGPDLFARFGLPAQPSQA
jgi:RNA polymerase sigma-70 factor, ECF subfamily